MATPSYDYGMIGLGTMGRNLVLNMSDQGFSVAGFDKNPHQVALLEQAATSRQLYGTMELKDFINVLKKPRVIFLLVPAGPVVDAVLDELLPFLSKGDLLVDAGNTHFEDTNRRMNHLRQQGIHFMGMGISGGEAGARSGPSIMPGGEKAVFVQVAPLLEAIAAKVGGEPCVAYLGAGSAGHYVKMVHNGIEYAIMQLISEFYHLLKEAGDLDNEALHTIFSKWNEGVLRSFLIEITAAILAKKDEWTGNYLLDMILDSAHQKGTGMWTSQHAMALHAPVTAIDAAVSMRDLSANKELRQQASQKLKKVTPAANLDKTAMLAQAESALYFATMIAYAQGMALLKKASDAYQYGLKLEAVANIWRGGCIIRAALLEDIRMAFAQNPNLENLLLSDSFAQKLNQLEAPLRTAIKLGIDAGIPMPASMAALAYFDSLRRGWLPANLIQAQRDFFGAHTYQRTDRAGNFHTEWR